MSLSKLVVKIDPVFLAFLQAHCRALLDEANESKSHLNRFINSLVRMVLPEITPESDAELADLFYEVYGRGDSNNISSLLDNQDNEKLDAFVGEDCSAENRIVGCKLLILEILKRISGQELTAEEKAKLARKLLRAVAQNSGGIKRGAFAHHCMEVMSSFVARESETKMILKQGNRDVNPIVLKDEKEFVGGYTLSSGLMIMDEQGIIMDEKEMIISADNAPFMSLKTEFSVGLDEYPYHVTSYEVTLNLDLERDEHKKIHDALKEMGTVSLDSSSSSSSSSDAPAEQSLEIGFPIFSKMLETPEGRKEFEKLDSKVIQELVAAYPELLNTPLPPQILSKLPKDVLSQISTNLILQSFEQFKEDWKKIDSDRGLLLKDRLEDLIKEECFWATADSERLFWKDLLKPEALARYSNEILKAIGSKLIQSSINEVNNKAQWLEIEAATIKNILAIYPLIGLPPEIFNKHFLSSYNAANASNYNAAHPSDALFKKSLKLYPEEWRTFERKNKKAFDTIFSRYRKLWKGSQGVDCLKAADLKDYSPFLLSKVDGQALKRSMVNDADWRQPGLIPTAVLDRMLKAQPLLFLCGAAPQRFFSALRLAAAPIDVLAQIDVERIKKSLNNSSPNNNWDGLSPEQLTHLLKAQPELWNEKKFRKPSLFRRIFDGVKSILGRTVEDPFRYKLKHEHLVELLTGGKTSTALAEILNDKNLFSQLLTGLTSKEAAQILVKNKGDSKQIEVLANNKNFYNLIRNAYNAQKQKVAVDYDPCLAQAYGILLCVKEKNLQPSEMRRKFFKEALKDGDFENYHLRLAGNSRLSDDDKKAAINKVIERFVKNEEFYTADDINGQLVTNLAEAGVSVCAPTSVKDLFQLILPSITPEPPVAQEKSIIPLNTGEHWCLLYLSPDQNNTIKIAYFDPLGHPIPRGLQRELESFYNEKSIQINICNVSTKVQYDNFNCGAWIVDMAPHVISAVDSSNTLQTVLHEKSLSNLYSSGEANAAHIKKARTEDCKVMLNMKVDCSAGSSFRTLFNYLTSCLLINIDLVDLNQLNQAFVSLNLDSKNAILIDFFQKLAKRHPVGFAKIVEHYKNLEGQGQPSIISQVIKEHFTSIVWDKSKFDSLREDAPIKKSLKNITKRTQDDESAETTFIREAACTVYFEGELLKQNGCDSLKEKVKEKNGGWKNITHNITQNLGNFAKGSINEYIKKKIYNYIAASVREKWFTHLSMIPETNLLKVEVLSSEILVKDFSSGSDKNVNCLDFISHACFHLALDQPDAKLEFVSLNCDLQDFRQGPVLEKIFSGENMPEDNFLIGSERFKSGQVEKSKFFEAKNSEMIDATKPKQPSNSSVVEGGRPESSAVPALEPSDSSVSGDDQGLSEAAGDARSEERDPVNPQAQALPLSSKDSSNPNKSPVNTCSAAFFTVSGRFSPETAKHLKQVSNGQIRCAF